MSEERLLKEKEFHDKRFGGDDGDRSVVDKYYRIMGKPRQMYRDVAAEASTGGKLLEYGCATGAESPMWLEQAAHVTGIDISSEAIKKAKQRFAGTEFEGRTEYFEMNAEAMDFEDGTFDVIVGNGIIHHLELNACYGELARVLKPGGTAVFMEPMGHNPLINWYRDKTPALRTEDEHPLLESDIELAKRYFHDVKAVPYNLTALAAVPFREKSFFPALVNFLHGLDSVLFRLPALRRQAWFSVLIMRNPVKPGAS